MSFLFFLILFFIIAHPQIDWLHPELPVTENNSVASHTFKTGLVQQPAIEPVLAKAQAGSCSLWIEAAW